VKAAVALALGVFVLAAGGLTLRSHAATNASTGARNGQIAWKAFPRAGDESRSAIYAANPDGSQLRQLTHPRAFWLDDLPDWSPDGSHILFARTFQSNVDPPTIPDEVMRIDADGKGLRQVGTCTGACVGNADPQYSPDGREIVYTRAMRVKGTSLLELGVWLMDSDGGNPREISPSVFGKSEDHEPAWSPDGKHIVFTRLNDFAAPVNEQALFVIDSSGGGKPRRITPWSLDAGGANWSPDGSRILFQSYRDCPCSETSQVYTVAADGSGLTQLTSVGRNIEPNWSPDGKKIIYARQPRASSLHLPDLWVMDASGRNKHVVVHTKLWESEPDWGIRAPVA
jgi:TolB protein